MELDRRRLLIGSAVGGGLLLGWTLLPRRHPLPLTRVAIALAPDATGVTVTATLRDYNEASLTRNLQNALVSRSVIDQAIGIIMATRRCPADEAFATLRGLSQTRNVRLAVIAQDLVDRTASGHPAVAHMPSRPGVMSPPTHQV